MTRHIPVRSVGARRAIAVTACVLAAAFCVQSALAASNTLKFGVSPSFPPYESIAPDGKMVGIDIEIGDALCKQIKVQCEWVKMDYASAIPALNVKKFDAILSAMQITEDRSKQVLFTIPFTNSLNTLVASKKYSSTNMDALLNGKRIGVAQGTMQQSYANTHWAKFATIVDYQNEELMQQDLRLGRIDFIFSDQPFSTRFLESPDGKDYHVVGEAITIGVGEGIAVRKGDTTLKDKLDAGLQAMANDGSLQNIVDQYSKYGITNLVKPQAK